MPQSGSGGTPDASPPAWPPQPPRQPAVPGQAVSAEVCFSEREVRALISSAVAEDLAIRDVDAAEGRHRSPSMRAREWTSRPGREVPSPPLQRGTPGRGPSPAPTISDAASSARCVGSLTPPGRRREEGGRQLTIPLLPLRGSGQLDEDAVDRLREAFRGKKVFESRNPMDILRFLTRSHTAADSRAVGAYLKKHGEKPHQSYPARVKQLLRSVQRSRAS